MPRKVRGANEVLLCCHYVIKATMALLARVTECIVNVVDFVHSDSLTSLFELITVQQFQN